MTYPTGGPPRKHSKSTCIAPKPLKFSQVSSKKLFSTKISKFLIWPLYDPYCRYGNMGPKSHFFVFREKRHHFFDILCTFTWKSICCPERYWFHLYKTSLECLNILLVIRFFASSFRQKCQNCDLGLRSHPHNFCGQGPRFLKKAWMSLLI